MFYKLSKEKFEKIYFVVRKRSSCIRKVDMKKKIYLEDLVELLFGCEVEVVDRNHLFAGLLVSAGEDLRQVFQYDFHVHPFPLLKVEISTPGWPPFERQLSVCMQGAPRGC